MTYIEKNRIPQGKKIIISLIGLIIVIFILIQVFIPHFFSAVLTSIAVPFWRAEFSLESGSLQSRESLLKENEALKREISDNSNRMSMVEYVDFENSQLRSMLHGTTSRQYILSAVLKRPPFYFYDELIVDSGLDKDISTTSIAYIEGDIPIGRVIEVFGKSSKVLLFSSPGEKNEVFIGKSNILAQAIGIGGGQFEVELPRGLDISLGDFITLADFDSRPIGKIVSIDSSSSLPFQKVLFAPLFNIYELRWILIDNQYGK